MVIKISAFFMVKAGSGLALWLSMWQKKKSLNWTSESGSSTQHHTAPSTHTHPTPLPQPWPSALDLGGADRAPASAGRTSPGRPSKAQTHPFHPPTPPRVSQEWGGAGGPGEPCWLRGCPGRGPWSWPEHNHGSQVPTPLHFSSHGGAGGLDPLAPGATVAAAFSCAAGSNPRSHCLISGTGLGSPRGSPSVETTPTTQVWTEAAPGSSRSPLPWRILCPMVAPQAGPLLLCGLPVLITGLLLW